MTLPPEHAKISSNPEEIFGQRMRARRTMLKISTRALAERMRQQGYEWHHATVQRTEVGQRPVRLGEATAIAGILSTSLASLLQVDASRHEAADALLWQLELARDTRGRLRTLMHSLRERLDFYRKEEQEAAKLAHAIADDLAVTTAEWQSAETKYDALRAQWAAIQRDLADEVDFRVISSAGKYRWELVRLDGKTLAHGSWRATPDEAAEDRTAFQRFSEDPLSEWKPLKREPGATHNDSEAEDG